MRRRQFIWLLGGAAVPRPIAARAQQSERLRRIGVLFVGDNPHSQTSDTGNPHVRLAAFQRELERLGWSEGRNTQIEVRFATKPEQARACAQELITQQPDVILASTTPAAIALQRETRTIPIIFVGVADPIGAGLITNLARPGANLSGLLSYEDTITGKWLAMLKEIAPHLDRVALVANPKTGPYDYFMRAARVVAPSLAIEIVPGPIDSEIDIEKKIASLAQMMNSGFMITPHATTVTHRDLIIALAARHHLPAVYFSSSYVSAGGLMSYGIDFLAHFWQAAGYVDRVLRGAKPADLPVQTPIKFETFFNLKTAQALGLTVPPGLLLAADEVIE